MELSGDRIDIVRDIRNAVATWQRRLSEVMCDVGLTN